MKMKKFVSVVLAAGLTLGLLSGCGGSGTSTAGTDDNIIVVGASPTPHAEILKAAEAVLKEKGYTLQIQEFTDYVQPNATLANDELDANYFQHEPYLLAPTWCLQAPSTTNPWGFMPVKPRLLPIWQMVPPLPFPTIPPMKPELYCF